MILPKLQAFSTFHEIKYCAQWRRTDINESLLQYIYNLSIYVDDVLLCNDTQAKQSARDQCP